MNIHKAVKSSVFSCLLITASISPSTTHARSSIDRISCVFESSHKLQTVANTLNYCAQLTMNGLSHTNYFMQTYAIPYTLAGFSHTKNFTRNYIIPALISASKTGYAASIWLYHEIMKAYQQRNARQQYNGPDTRPADHEAEIPVQEVALVTEPSAPPMEECAICNEPLNDNGVTLQPCGHHEICGQCAQNNFLTWGRTQCPFCNQNVDQVVPASVDFLIPSSNSSTTS